MSGGQFKTIVKADGTRNCATCKINFPIDKFDRRSKNSKYYISSCRDCHRQASLEWKRRNKEYLKEYSAAIPTEVRTKRKREWTARYPEKRRAHRLVNYAIEKGTLLKEPCVRCGRSAQAHHEDYSKPLDVVWLCPKHHAERHSEIDEQRKRAQEICPVGD